MNLIATLSYAQNVVIDASCVELYLSVNLGVIFLRFALAENLDLLCSLLLHDISQAKLVEEAGRFNLAFSLYDAVLGVIAV